MRLTRVAIPEDPDVAQLLRTVVLALALAMAARLNKQRRRLLQARAVTTHPLMRMSILGIFSSRHDPLTLAFPENYRSDPILSDNARARMHTNVPEMFPTNGSLPRFLSEAHVFDEVKNRLSWG